MQTYFDQGVKKVIVAAPTEGALNIVYGVNHDDMVEDESLISAASCTTNAIVPVLKAIHDRFGIAHGHIETVHAYTNDQNLLDNYHKKERRGRGAPLNLVLTETGAASAVAKALPNWRANSLVTPSAPPFPMCLWPCSI